MRQNILLPRRPSKISKLPFVVFGIIGVSLGILLIALLSLANR